MRVSKWRFHSKTRCSTRSCSARSKVDHGQLFIGALAHKVEKLRIGSEIEANVDELAKEEDDPVAIEGAVSGIHVGNALVVPSAQNVFAQEELVKLSS